MSTCAGGDESRRHHGRLQGLLTARSGWRQSWTNLASSGRYWFLFSNRNGPVPSALMPASMWQLVIASIVGTGTPGPPPGLPRCRRDRRCLPDGGWRKLPYMRAEDLSDPLQQSRFGQLEVGGLPVVPVVQTLHHHGEVGKSTTAPTPSEYSRALGRWLPTRRRYLSLAAVVGVEFIGWARPLLPGPVAR